MCDMFQLILLVHSFAALLLQITVALVYNICNVWFEIFFWKVAVCLSVCLQLFNLFKSGFFDNVGVKKYCKLQYTV